MGIKPEPASHVHEEKDQKLDALKSYLNFSAAKFTKNGEDIVVSINSEVTKYVENRLQSANSKLQDIGLKEGIDYSLSDNPHSMVIHRKALPEITEHMDSYDKFINTGMNKIYELAKKTGGELTLAGDDGISISFRDDNHQVRSAKAEALFKDMELAGFVPGKEIVREFGFPGLTEFAVGVEGTALKKLTKPVDQMIEEAAAPKRLHPFDVFKDAIGAKPEGVMLDNSAATKPAPIIGGQAHSK